LVEIARPRVVAEAPPLREHVPLLRRGEPLQRREALQEALPVLEHATHLRLLQHQLADEDRVGIARLAPREVGGVAAVPRAQLRAELPELERVQLRCRRRAPGPQCGSHVGTAEKSPPSTMSSRASSTPNTMLSAPAATWMDTRIFRILLPAYSAGMARIAVTIIIPSTVPKPNISRYAAAAQGSRIVASTSSATAAEPARPCTTPMSSGRVSFGASSSPRRRMLE